jgi:xanthine dehydrogenase accessory factor
VRAVREANERGEEVVSVLKLNGDDAGSRTIIHSSELPDVGKDYYAELHTPAPALVIVGAGHIAVPLAQMGVMLGFRVSVVDDRSDFADTSRFPDAVAVSTLDFEQPLERIKLDANTFIVLVTRAHKYDYDCLRQILKRESLPRYIGMIGSKRRVRAAFTALRNDGVTEQRLAAVHAPVGLDIGAETPAEIAVSIMAEIISVRRTVQDDRPIYDALRENLVLATVVSTKGSVPRRAGSKMLVDVETNALVGTIGGGCGEADVLAIAPEVARTGEPRVVHVELIDSIDSFSPAVCGGVMDVFVERVR